METLRKTYSYDIYPIPHPEEWNVPNEVKSKIVGVPTNPTQADRPCISSIKSSFASLSRSSRRVCSRYHQSGHNRASCSATIPNTIVDESGFSSLSADKLEKGKLFIAKICPPNPTIHI